MKKMLVILILFFILGSASADLTVQRIMIDSHWEIKPYIKSPYQSSSASRLSL